MPRVAPLMLFGCAAAALTSHAAPVRRPAQGAAPAVVRGVPAQPLLAQVRRVADALRHLGSPLPSSTLAELERAERESGDAAASERVQKALDRHCLVAVHINPESRVKAARGPVRPELAQQGWRVFLVKVHNEAGVTAQLRVFSPNAGRAYDQQPGNNPRRAKEIDQRRIWMDVALHDSQPLQPTLSGLPLEYRVIQIYSRDAGPREAKLEFNVGQGTQDLGFRAETDILFQCLPAHPVTLRVRDENDKPTTAMFLVRDRQGRIYPSQSKRLAPDFWFHPQVYRADGEKLMLPAGEYEVECTRGPEYLVQRRTLVVRGPQRADFRLQRWTDPSLSGWWSGDHHIHAAGCAHYTNPTEGVHPPDMMRHCLGEDLKVGCSLTWGPCFDYQKQFFTGRVDKVSRYPYLLRYDVEVSGFGSHESGHLCLLRLKEQIYPGGDSWTHWPTLGLNTLRWAKKQGAVCGPAHSGWGLEVPTGDLPNYLIPPFNGIGANEYIVDVTHEVEGPEGRPVPAVDFLSTVDTPYVWELNIWYHTLNCGFRTRISGETDFPCIYGERVGLGRSYVKLDGRLDFDSWTEGIRKGRNYVGDGRSHLMDFAVNGQAMGEGESEVRLERPGSVRATARVAALLPERPDPSIARRPYTAQPYWHIERARIGASREVPVEVIVNGLPVARKTIVADGVTRTVEFEVPIERSSWVALRILPSSHTNPVFVLVGGRPVRASRRSAEWCLKSVEQCWSQKRSKIDADEMDDAVRAYDHARAAYRRILAECEAD